MRDSDGCYTCEILYEMYSDKTNSAFLLFLHPVLDEVQRVNRIFE